MFGLVGRAATRWRDRRLACPPFMRNKATRYWPVMLLSRSTVELCMYIPMDLCYVINGRCAPEAQVGGLGAANSDKRLGGESAT